MQCPTNDTMFVSPVCVSMLTVETVYCTRSQSDQMRYPTDDTQCPTNDIIFVSRLCVSMLNVEKFYCTSRRGDPNAVL